MPGIFGPGDERGVNSLPTCCACVLLSATFTLPLGLLAVFRTGGVGRRWLKILLSRHPWRSGLYRHHVIYAVWNFPAMKWIEEDTTRRIQAVSPARCCLAFRAAVVV